MKIATLRTDQGMAAVRIDAEEAIVVESFTDVGQLLASGPGWRQRAEEADGRRHHLSTIEAHQWAPVIPRPGKILCVGLNYRQHILEMGREVPEYPTIFTKYPEALIGAYEPIRWSARSSAMDWEAELAVVVGREVFEATAEQAEQAIAGYAVLNDVTLRDYQYHTTQWLPGKTFAETTPLGPYLTTTDAYEPGAITTTVNGVVKQKSSTADLVFPPVALVEYLSQILPLKPGDVIATGTPGGVGHAQKPPTYLKPGDVVETAIEGLGELRNVVGN